jgi:hypothetical protein
MGILVGQTLRLSFHHLALSGCNRGVISLLQHTEALVDGFVGPLARKELYRPVTNVFALHFSHGLDVILAFEQTNEAIALTLLGLLILNNFTHLKASEFLEGVAQDVVRDLVSEIAAIYSKVVFWPIGKTVVHPLLTSRLTKNFQLSFVFVRNYQVFLFVCVRSISLHFRFRGGKGETSVLRLDL